MSGNPEKFKLPRRDLFLLPLVSLLTIVVLWAGAEIVARAAFEESGREICTVKGAIPGRMKPDCVSTRKAAEGPDVRMAYNDCGYRTRESCGPRPPGTLRIALLGASTAQGFKVPFAESFGQRLNEELTRACRRPVEVQNMAMPGYELVDSYMRTGEALRLKPDLVMFLFGAYDIEAISSPKRLQDRDHPELLRDASTGTGKPRPRGLLKRLVDLTADSRALVMAQHFLYSDRDTYVKLFLLYGDKADYVRRPLTPLWQKRLSIAQMLLSGMAKKIAAAGVPFADVIAPTELQVSLLNAADRPRNVDPYEVDRRIDAIAAENGMISIDTLPAFADVKTPADVFYSVDGHLNGDGHAILAQAVLRRLTDGSVPAFAGCRPEPMLASRKP